MSRRSFAALLLFVMVIGAGAAIYLAAHSIRPVSANLPKASRVSLPLFFEPNQGQTDPQVKFLARGSGYGLFLTASEAVLTLQPSALSTQHSASSVIRMRLEGASANTGVSGIERLPGKSNYFIGNDSSRWQRGIPQFARVEYSAVYPGINLVYYGNEGHLEYDFRVAPAADPNQIALTFEGASARLQDGDLVLSTEHGDLQFHAPRVYQRANGGEQEIGGSFRQLAENKIGFSIGAYDRNRELIIDPVLSYSTYLGGSLAESSVHVAIGQDNNVYLAGSTASSNFPVTTSATLTGTQNIFIAVINPAMPSGQQLLYATFLGGNGIDTAAGLGVTPHIDQNTSGYDVYVAGSTTSTDFPTNGVLTPFQTAPPVANTHGFVSRLNVGNNQLSYSTYVAGHGADFVTGLAVDLRGDAFVTGTTTSTDSATGFPSTLNAFQVCPWQQGVVTCPTPFGGPPQFFASKINTAGTGAQSMLYSTFFGGGYVGTTATGGSIAVDASGNMYFTGGTNIPSVQGPNPTDFPFPITANAQQACLNVPASAGGSCQPPTTPQALDGFVAKINPNVAAQAPVFSTYLGGTADDVAAGVAVDGSSNVYVTGQTNSGDWIFPTAITPFQSAKAAGADAFLAKIANPASATTVFPLIYFTYLGGGGDDFGHGIVVDATQNAHLVGTTSSADLPVKNNFQGFGGSSDAFVALISTTIASSSTASGNYLTYLGGSGAEEGTGIALDVNNAAYVSGSTTSANFPVVNALQPSLGGSQDAFVSRLGASSTLSLTAATNSPSPNPPVAGTPVAFTFDIANTGPDPATNVIFTANLPTSGVASQTAKVTSGSGSCGGVVSNTITCTISSLAVQSSSTTGFGVVEVDVTPTLPVLPGNAVLTVLGSVSANGGPVQSTKSQSTEPITDFSVSATPAQQTVTAGQNTSFTVTLSPAPTYTATVSMTDSGLPAASTATFTTSSVAMSGTSQSTTTLNISTTARPVTSGSLFRGHAFYATWLPIGGLSLLGLGVGASKKRRTWIGIALLGLLAGLLLVQPGCGSSSPTTTTGGTPAGTYTITITGTSGSVSHNTTVRLVVN